MNLAEKCRTMADAYWKQEYDKINLLFQQSLFVNRAQCIESLRDFIEFEAERGKYSTEIKRGIHHESKGRELGGYEDIVKNYFEFVNDTRNEVLSAYARSMFEKWLVSELTNFVDVFSKLTGIETTFEITAFGGCTTFSYYLRFSWAKK